MTTLTEKDPLEIIPVTFEFVNLTGAPITPVVTITQTAGPQDDNVSDMADGSPVVIGTKVRQKITAGISGAEYELQCQVDTSEGYRYIVAGILPVRDQ